MLAFGYFAWFPDVKGKVTSVVISRVTPHSVCKCTYCRVLSN